MKLNLAYKFALVASAVSVSAVALPQKGGAPPCKADDLSKCFASYRPVASAYCSFFFGIAYPKVTQTTTIPGPTSTVTSTVASRSTSTSTISSGISTATEFTTAVVSTTVTSITTIGALKPRDNAGPACLKAFKGKPTNYLPAAQSSACSCLGVTPATKTLTSTAAVATTTKITTIPIVEKVTITVVSSTTTFTSTITSTSTETISSTFRPDPTCSSQVIRNGGFEVIVSENYANPWSFLGQWTLPARSDCRTGSRCFLAQLPDSALMIQDLTSCPERTYRLSFWMNVLAVQGNCIVGAFGGEKAPVMESVPLSVTNGYIELTGTYLSAPLPPPDLNDPDQLGIEVLCFRRPNQVNTATVLIDDVTLTLVE